MKKEELRVIPMKNYIILGIVILVTILLVYYFYMWSYAYKESKLSEPIMDSYMNVINYNELDDYLIENPDTVIYVSVLENEEIRKFEKKFKKIFKNNEVNREILYLDITAGTSNKQINSRYNINVNDIPAILVFENGQLKTTYSISNNDYDISRLKMFINNIKYNEEDEVND